MTARRQPVGSIPRDTWTAVNARVLSALAHSTDHAVLAVLPEALSPLNPRTYTGYYRLIEAGLSASGRRFLEELMRTRAVVRLLEVRGVLVDTDAQRRIQECRDEEQLVAWLSKAANARTVDEIFA